MQNKKPWQVMQSGYIVDSEGNIVNGNIDNNIHIVKCVNIHDDLIAALKTIVNMASSEARYYEIYKFTDEVIKMALSEPKQTPSTEA